MLHDAVEDQGGLPTLERIRQRFGPEVAAIVEGCTDAVVVPKPPWRERKIAYIAKVATKPASVRRVSSADKLHNARAILADYRVHGEVLWERFNGGREGTLWYYRELSAAFAKAEDTALARELALTVGELARLAERTPPAIAEAAWNVVIASLRLSGRIQPPPDARGDA